MDWTEFDDTFGAFLAADLSAPGTVIEVGPQEFLIGDVNTLGGGCDDCPVVRRDDVVTRYRKLEGY